MGTIKLKEKDESMSLEEQTRENTRNISSLTTTVTELATMFKFTEKARDEERQDVKSAVAELKTLNQKITEMSTIQKDVNQLSGDFRALSHDMKNVQNAIQAIGLLKDRLSENGETLAKHETRLDSIETWRSETKGATGAVKILIHTIWAFVSVGGLSFIAWIMTNYNKVTMVVGKIDGE